MSKRSQLESLLHDYVAGDLGADKAREVEMRLQTEPETRTLLEEIRAVHNALLTLRERPAPPVEADDALPHIYAAIAAPSFEPKPLLALEGEGTRFYRRIALAATLLLAVTVALLAINRTGDDAPPETNTPTARDLEPVSLDDFVNASRTGSMNGLQYLRMLRELHNARDLRVRPVIDAVPVTFGTSDTR